MRTNFAISATGHIFFPDETPASRHVIFAERRAHAVKLSIKPNAPPVALMKLLRHIRDIKGQILIESRTAHPKKLVLETADACIYIGRLALKNYEQAHQSIMTSDIAFWSDYSSIGNHAAAPSAIIANIPKEITSLANMRLGELDTATALTHLSQAEMQQTTFIYPDADQNLHIGKMPPRLIWPPEPYLEAEAHSDWAPEPFSLWLRLVCEVALAARKPLLHFGQFHMHHTKTNQLPELVGSSNEANLGEINPGEINPNETIPSQTNPSETNSSQINLNQIDTAMSTQQADFIRLLYPLTADKEKPDNYRLISLAYRLTDEAPIL